jgi:hypothetical protein
MYLINYQTFFLFLIYFFQVLQLDFSNQKLELEEMEKIKKEIARLEDERHVNEPNDDVFLETTSFQKGSETNHLILGFKNTIDDIFEKFLKRENIENRW